MSTGTRRWGTRAAPRVARPGPGQPGDRYLGHTDVGIAIGPSPGGLELRVLRSGRRYLLAGRDHGRWFAWDARRACWRLKCCLAGRCAERRESP